MPIRLSFAIIRGASMPRRFPRLASLAVMLTIALAAFQTSRADDPFAIKEGDRIVFYGDSITDQRLYTTFVETYIVTRFPSMNVSFVHSGWGGDRVTGGGGGPIDHRLDARRLRLQADGRHRHAGHERRQLSAVQAADLRRLRQGLRAPGRVAQENLPGRADHADPAVARSTTSPGSRNSRADTIRCSSAMASSSSSWPRRRGRAVADLNTSVVAALKKAHGDRSQNAAQELIHDRVHPGPGRPVADGRGTAQGVERPRAWSRRSRSTPAAARSIKPGECQGRRPQGRRDDLLDAARCGPADADRPEGPGHRAGGEGVGRRAGAQPADLKVTGLAAPKYQLKIDGKDVAELTKDQLAAGVNLAEYDTPMFRQATAVHRLTLRHNDLHFQRWRALQVPGEQAGYPNLAKAIEGLDALESDYVMEQRQKAKPKPHRFELVPKNGPVSVTLR